MYGSPTGSISGVLHMVARRPVIAAAIVSTVVAITTLQPSTHAVPPEPKAPVVTSTTVEQTSPAPHFSSIGNCVLITGHVDNVCKATLDNAAIALEAAPGSTLVIEGYEQRANEVRAYLTSGEGKAKIPASNIVIRPYDASRAGRNPSVTITLVPPGAKYEGQFPDNQ